MKGFIDIISNGVTLRVAVSAVVAIVDRDKQGSSIILNTSLGLYGLQHVLPLELPYSEALALVEQAYY